MEDSPGCSGETPLITVNAQIKETVESFFIGLRYSECTNVSV